MTDYDDLLKDAVDILVGPTIEKIKNWDENEHPIPSDKHSEILKAREVAEFEVKLNVGYSKECLFSVGKLSGSDEEFKSDLEEMAPPGTFHHDGAALPSEQRQDFQELRAKIRTLQTCFRRMNWASKERLAKASSPEMWDELDNRLNLAISKIEAAIEDTPNPRGGAVPNEYPRDHVNECFSTFDAFRPGEASSDEGSNFHTYVYIIHGLATGEREGDYVRDTKRRLSFERPIKAVLRFQRERKGPDFTHEE